MERKASDLFVECLEAEGVKYVFGIPGEETLDLNESLADSVDRVHPGSPRAGRRLHGRHVRAPHAARRRLPRARSARAPRTSITAVADAFLDRSPLVALTGQGDLERMHKESHQYIDVVSMHEAGRRSGTRG